MNEEKSCKNCRYYAQHYVKQTKRFRAVNCGHCTKRLGKILQVCGYWENTEIILEQRKQSIKNIIEDMAKNLKEIAEVLINDERD